MTDERAGAVAVFVGIGVVLLVGQASVIAGFAAAENTHVRIHEGGDYGTRNDARSVYQGQDVLLVADEPATNVLIRNVETGGVVLDGDTGADSRRLSFDTENLHAGATYKILFDGDEATAQYMNVTSPLTEVMETHTPTRRRQRRQQHRLRRRHHRRPRRRQQHRHRRRQQHRLRRQRRRRRRQQRRCLPRHQRQLRRRQRRKDRRPIA